jgi:hypothetical protein
VTRQRPARLEPLLGGLIVVLTLIIVPLAAFGRL